MPEISTQRQLLTCLGVAPFLECLRWCAGHFIFSEQQVSTGGDWALTWALGQMGSGADYGEMGSKEILYLTVVLFSSYVSFYFHKIPKRCGLTF